MMEGFAMVIRASETHSDFTAGILMKNSRNCHKSLSKWRDESWCFGFYPHWLWQLLPHFCCDCNIPKLRTSSISREHCQKTKTKNQIWAHLSALPEMWCWNVNRLWLIHLSPPESLEGHWMMADLTRTNMDFVTSLTGAANLPVDERERVNSVSALWWTLPLPLHLFLPFTVLHHNKCPIYFLLS